MARQLRWLSPVEVTADDDHRALGVPGLHRLTARVGDTIDVDSPKDPERFLRPADNLGFPSLADHRSLLEDAQQDVDFEPDVLPPRRLHLIGGGPIGRPWGIDEQWDYTFGALLGDLDTRPEWRAWWEQTDLPECCMYYETARPATRVRIRRSAKEVRVTLSKPLQETTNPVAEARADAAETLIEALTQRFGLPPAPPLDH